MTFEQLITQQRRHINQVVRDLSRRHFLAEAETEEFGETVIRALERNDFELLRAFDGRSTWETYLTLVVSREFFLFQGDLWGQWRPTASASRLGPAGVLLEELVLRDHLPVVEAAELMRTVHRVDLPKYRILELAQQLRLERGRATAGAVNGAGDDGFAESTVHAALNDALGRLQPDDRLIVQLRFRDRQPLTRIARVMHVEVRPLQRRLEHVKKVIGEALLSQGIASEDVHALLQHAERDTVHPHQNWWHAVRTRPSK